MVPGPADNVTIADSDAVTIDVNFTIGNLTIGEGVSGNARAVAGAGFHAGLRALAAQAEGS